MKLISWNVNGLRAVAKKGFARWMRDIGADIIAVQETKAQPDQFPDELRNVPGYHLYLHSAERKGYSGVALWARQEPVSVLLKTGQEEFDREGRILRLDWDRFTLFNIYFPNGKASPERLDYKMRFYDMILEEAARLRSSRRSVIICGDVNTAHREIDLARPRENSTVSGFLPEERAWIDRLLAAGFIDSFRHLHPEPDRYSWWDYKTRARERNIGWRIDYVFISKDLLDVLKASFILDEIYGSDHCPVGIDLDL
ncbi:MAG TPA: exodeoxyribonuclease III [Firmicutes bacterium]|nr:exodeoxyribonuclease III [Bacillota bacterium]